MKVLGIIPSRYGSSRFPGKPLIDIAGKSMIQRVYEGASRSKQIDQVIVATDDDRIFQAVKDFGGEVMMTAETHQSGTDRCGEVIQSMQEYDVVINIQGDEPLIQSAQLNELISAFQAEEVKIATLVKPIQDLEDIQNPNRIKVVLDSERRALYFSRSPIPYLANVEEDKWLETNTFYKHIGIYAWRSDVLRELVQLEPTELEVVESLEQLRWLYHGHSIHTIESQIETPNIDVPDDLEKVLRVISNDPLMS